MAWLSKIGITLYYITLPVTTLLRLIWGILSYVLAPIEYVGGFIIAAILLPFQWMAKFESLYIYLSVAAVVGFITGSILHLSSSLLVSMLNLAPPSEVEVKGRTAASVRAAREQKMLEDAWKTSSNKPQSGDRTGSDSLEERYTQWLEKDAGKRRKKGVVGQTILEEDDDSMDGF